MYKRITPPTLNKKKSEKKSKKRGVLKSLDWWPVVAGTGTVGRSRQ
jgi:hypothetical protein